MILTLVQCYSCKSCENSYFCDKICSQIVTFFSDCQVCCFQPCLLMSWFIIAVSRKKKYVAVTKDEETGQEVMMVEPNYADQGQLEEDVNVVLTDVEEEEEAIMEKSALAIAMEAQTKRLQAGKELAERLISRRELLHKEIERMETYKLARMESSIRKLRGGKVTKKKGMAHRRTVPDQSTSSQDCDGSQDCDEVEDDEELVSGLGPVRIVYDEGDEDIDIGDHPYDYHTDDDAKVESPGLKISASISLAGFVQHIGETSPNVEKETEPSHFGKQVKMEGVDSKDDVLLDTIKHEPACVFVVPPGGESSVQSESSDGDVGTKRKVDTDENDVPEKMLTLGDASDSSSIT